MADMAFAHKIIRLNTLVVPSKYITDVYDQIISSLKSALTDPFFEFYDNTKITELRKKLISQGHMVKDTDWEPTRPYYVLTVDMHEDILKLAWSSLKHASEPSGEPWEVIELEY